jgi:hypothetical protein
MAANTDKFRKKKSQFSTTIPAPGIDENAVTIPLLSSSGLATDTAVTLTLDRIDSNGAATPLLAERVTGVISGTNLTNVLRGQDGTTAVAHAANAVVEDTWDADTWNDAVDAILEEHDQDGGHNDITATTVTTTGDVTVGDDLTVTGDGEIVSSLSVGTTLTAGTDILLGATSILPGWIEAGETWTYASAITFTISGDKTLKYNAGMKIKLSQTTAKYFIITKVEYSNPNTTITIYGGTDYTLANAAITGPFYSVYKSPAGFPMSPTKWTITTTDTTARSQASPTTETWYNLGSVTIAIPIGAWITGYFVAAGIGFTTQTNSSVTVSLSTANNTIGVGTTYYVQTVASATGGWTTSLARDVYLDVTTATTYYLNTKTDGTATTLNNSNNLLAARIYAVCAYL